jgi:glycosyltransferase involved in cell wall biosynthesis
MITVIILTWNDEVQIENLLKSIHGWTNQIIVVDSNSTDATRDICLKYDVEFYTHSFINQAVQFNWALDNLKISSEWVLRLDSDESISRELKEEIIYTITNPEFQNISAYYINRKIIFMGRWLRHGRVYPQYLVRLFRYGYAKYEERTEEHMVVNGLTRKLKNTFSEDNKKNNLKYFTEKHLITAEGEVAEEMKIKQLKDGIDPKLFGSNEERTRWLKVKLYYKIPIFLRSLIYFIYRYIIYMGFLDGKPGLIFNVLQAFWYRFYIDARLYENHIIKRSEK